MDGKIEPQPTPGGTKVYPHQQSPYRMANERVSDVSDRNLYGQVPNYFALPIQLYLEFDHKNESSTIRIAHREQDKQMTFDCRPNKILYVKLRWKNTDMARNFQGASFRLRAEVTGIKQNMDLVQVHKSNKCKKCASSVSAFHLGEGPSASWTSERFDMLVHPNPLSIRELLEGLVLPIKVHCTSAKHDVSAFHMLFTLERINPGPPQTYELLGRVALSPINSRKRAGKANAKKDDDDSSGPEDVPRSQSAAAPRATGQVPAQAVVMGSTVGKQQRGGGGNVVIERKRILNRIDPAVFVPPDQPLLLVKENDELPFSTAYVVGVADRSSGPARALQPPTQSYLRSLARNLGSTFESSDKAHRNTLWDKLRPVLACYTLEPDDYKDVLMNHVLIPLMDDGIPRDTYNAFLKWFGEPSAWVEKLEMLKPVATRKFFHGFAGADSCCNKLLEKPVMGSFCLRFSRSRERDNGLVLVAYDNQQESGIIEYPIMLRESGEVEMLLQNVDENNNMYTEVHVYDCLDHLLARNLQFKYGLRRDYSR